MGGLTREEIMERPSGGTAFESVRYTIERERINRVAVRRRIEELIERERERAIPEYFFPSSLLSSFPLFNDLLSSSSRLPALLDQSRRGNQTERAAAPSPPPPNHLAPAEESVKRLHANKLYLSIHLRRTLCLSPRN